MLTRTNAAAAEPGEAALTDRRLDELLRWHGTDETNLPPPETLQHLSRDTVAALQELQRARRDLLRSRGEMQQSRAEIERMRRLLDRAFWATSFEEVHAAILDALGPPPPAPPG